MIFLVLGIFLGAAYLLFLSPDFLEFAIGLWRVSLVVLGLMVSRFEEILPVELAIFFYVGLVLVLLGSIRKEVQVHDHES